MRVVVFVKQVLDPEASPRDFRVDRETKVAVQGRLSLVMSVFDEIALEVALRFRDASKGAVFEETRVVAVSLGSARAEDVLRKALAMTADEAILINDEGLGDPLQGIGRVDAFLTAKVLAAAVRRLGGADLILCGRQAADTDAGHVGLLVAEELGFPAVTAATSVEPHLTPVPGQGGGAVRVLRESHLGWEVVECPLPVVVTVTNSDTNVPRIPKVKDVMAASRKTVVQWDANELVPGLVDGGSGFLSANVYDLFVPVRDKRCEFIEGDSPEARAGRLAERILDLKVL